MCQVSGVKARGKSLTVLPATNQREKKIKKKNKAPNEKRNNPKSLQQN